MKSEPNRLAIGALSERTGCNIETIRYYERVGLLPAPGRSPGGYRLYGNAHLRRLVFIRRARALGFSLDEVRTLLKLADGRKRPCTDVRVVAARHLEDVRAKLADLKSMERVLADTVARCAKGDGSHCPVIDALSRNGSDPESTTFSDTRSVAVLPRRRKRCQSSRDRPAPDSAPAASATRVPASIPKPSARIR